MDYDKYSVVGISDITLYYSVSI